MSKQKCTACGGAGKFVKTSMQDFGRGDTEETRCGACTGFGVIYTKDATPAPVDAGTIQRYYASPQIGEGAVAAEHGDYVLYADHLQHTAAAVAAAEQNVRTEYETKLAAFIEKGREEREEGLAQINRVIAALELRAATAPVSAAPEDFVAKQQFLDWSRAFDDEPVRVGVEYAVFDKAAELVRASLPPSAGAPVSAADQFCDANCTWLDHAPGCERAEAAPVSAAEQAPAKTNAHGLEAAGVGDTLAQVGTSADASVARPADGNELPALPKHSAEFRGERLFDLYTLRQYARDALAMHQPQGEGDENG